MNKGFCAMIGCLKDATHGSLCQAHAQATQAQPKKGIELIGGSSRFNEILQELADLHERKRADYGTSLDPFANVRATETWGIRPWIGACIRLNDKVARLQTMSRNGRLRNEPAEDSLRDIAVYAIIALILYEQDQLSVHTERQG
jgi:hypothetical protein